MRSLHPRASCLTNLSDLKLSLFNKTPAMEITSCCSLIVRKIKLQC